MAEQPGGADPDAVAAALDALAPLAGPEGRVLAGGPLGILTTYRVGGPAAVQVTVTTDADLAVVSGAVAASGLPVLVVGRGSNLLVADAGYPGIAVLLDPDGFGNVSLEGASVRAGAAVPMPTLARQTVEAGLTGFEWAVGVPGSVGGGVRMNAGGHGSDIDHCITEARVVGVGGGPGQPETRSRRQLCYGYRRSSIGVTDVVVAAEFALEPGDPETGRETIREIVRWRREHQPGGQNAGSVFTNPPDSSAGWLIDAAGLKGRRWRSATVSPKHANFIQADSGGSADDVRALIEQVQAEVELHHGIALVPEVRMIGFHNHQPMVES
jgi:UDP-N-acetylmuramate dehydrogenase